MIVSNEAAIIGRLEAKPDTIYLLEADLAPPDQQALASAIRQATNSKVMFLIFHPGIIRSINEMNCEQLERVRDSIILVCNRAIEDVRKFTTKSPEQCLKEDVEHATASHAA